MPQGFLTVRTKKGWGCTAVVFAVNRGGGGGGALKIRCWCTYIVLILYL